MQFFSTRDQNRKVTSSQAIAQGLSDEGGLFVPESFPQVDVKALCGLDYPALAAAVVREYLTDYNPAFLTEATRSTYGAAFGGKAGYLAPVEGDTYALELWHGPTCAFKDYALQLMPKLLVEAKKNLGRTEKTLILVATSGDTGKAALDGYHDIPGVEIAVFYPTGGTSEIQRLQMATQEGANVAVYAVRGNFDDAQTGVKKVFGDKAIAAELEQRNIRLSSANSIMWIIASQFPGTHRLRSVFLQDQMINCIVVAVCRYPVLFLSNIQWLVRHWVQYISIVLLRWQGCCSGFVVPHNRDYRLLCQAIPLGVLGCRALPLSVKVVSVRRQERHKRQFVKKGPVVCLV